eukprot:UN03960
MATFQQLLDKATEEIDGFQTQILQRVQVADTPTLPRVAEEKRGNLQSLSLNLQSKRTLRGHFGKIYAMHWSPANPQLLVSASQDGKLLLWNAFTTARIQAIPLRSSWVMTCAFSPNGKLVASGGLDNICSVYRVNENMTLAQMESNQRQQPVAELTGHEGYLSCARFVTDNEIVTSSGDSTCMIWDVTQQQSIQPFLGHYGDVMSISAYGNNLFVSGSVDGTAKLWDLRSKSTQSIKTFRGHESDINSVSFFPDGNAFVSGSDDSTCRLFDIRAVSQINKYTSPQLVCGVTSVAFSSSGKLIFTGYDDNTAHVWDTVTGTDLQTLHHDYRISCCSLNNDGHAVATGSWDATLQVWA